MNPCKVVLVGGEWNDAVGRHSHLFEQFVSGFSAAVGTGWTLNVHNGGSLQALQNSVLRCVDTATVCVWIPSVDNEEEKILPTLKKRNPHMVLISSKQDGRGVYSWIDLVSRALTSHSNLLLRFTREPRESRWQASLLDPLGNLFFQDEINFGQAGFLTARRALQLASYTRVCSVREGDAEKPPEEVFGLLEELSDVSEQMKQCVPGQVYTERFPGNVSFRCSLGFPSMRSGEQIWVSRRNVDKTRLTAEDFVRVELALDGHTRYWGDALPSVDTPVQLRLYAEYPRVRYMLHGHAYLADQPFPEGPVCPCGVLEEMEYIRSRVDWRLRGGLPTMLNLPGHGFLQMRVEPQFYAYLSPRPFPENHSPGLLFQ